MIAEMIEEDARRLDDILADLNREANKHKATRDDYSKQASVLAEKRDRLQAQARRLSSQAAVYKQQRDECNLSVREAKQKRDEWNDRAARMRAAGGLGDIGEAKSQAQNWHQKVVKYSQDGQLAHDKMHNLMDEAGKLRQEAQVCHEQCLTCRKAADSEHEKYIATIRKIEMVRDNLPD